MRRRKLGGEEPVVHHQPHGAPPHTKEGGRAIARSAVQGRAAARMGGGGAGTRQFDTWGFWTFSEQLGWVGDLSDWQD